MMITLFYCLGIIFSAGAADQYSSNSALPTLLTDQSSFNSFFNPDAVPQPSAGQSSFNSVFNPDAVPQPSVDQSSFNSVFHSEAVPQLVTSQSSFNNIINPNAVQQPTAYQSSFNNVINPNAVQQPLGGQKSFNSVSYPNAVSQHLQESSSDLRKQIFSKTVITFATNFIQKLLASQRFVDAFSLHKLSRQRAAQFFYDLVYKDNIKAGNRDPAFSAFTVSQAVKYNYRTAESPHLMEVYAYTTGELLYQKRYLTAENAKTVSDMYFKATTELIEAANAHSPQENITAIRHGFINFLTSTNLFKGLSYVFDSAFAQVLYALRE